MSLYNILIVIYMHNYKTFFSGYLASPLPFEISFFSIDGIIRWELNMIIANETEFKQLARHCYPGENDVK